MRGKKWVSALLGLVAGLGVAGAAAATSTFEVFTYNIKGLPPAIEPDRTTEIGQIGPKLETRRQAVGDQIVHLQEDFYQPYHDSITAATAYSNESARTTDGTFATGDGLAHLSDFSSTAPTHTAWTLCGANKGDCATPKGYTFTDFTLDTGVNLHVYNLHMDAGQLQEDKDARTSQFAQLQTAMNTNSSAQAVIVMGDFNSRYTLVDDVVDTFLSDQGLTDAWVTPSSRIRVSPMPGCSSETPAACRAPAATSIAAARRRAAARRAATSTPAATPAS